MASTNPSPASPGLMGALRNVTTASPTTTTVVRAMSVSANDSFLQSLFLPNDSIFWNASTTFQNETTTHSNEYNNDFSSWLSIRLVVIVSILVGIVLLACGSYTISKRWSQHRKTKNHYKSTLLL